MMMQILSGHGTHSLMKMDKQCLHLQSLLYAQGNQVDVSSYKDPCKYGGDTGIKRSKSNDQKVKGMSESSIRGMDISSYIALKKAGGNIMIMKEMRHRY